MNALIFEKKKLINYRESSKIDVKKMVYGQRIKQYENGMKRVQGNVTCNKNLKRKKMKDVKTRLKALRKREMKGSLINNPNVET